MKKQEKINILDTLIERTNQLTYNKQSPHRPIIDDTLSFLRNTFEKDNALNWEKRINDIWWTLAFLTTNTPEYRFIEAWESGRTEFNNVLLSIKQEVELYTPENSITDNEINDDIKTPMIFLSHSSSDKKFADALERFFIGLGIKNDQLIYTSHPLHKIPLDANIYDFLRKNIHKKIFMIILWSDTYLESPACLNEMGAAWVVQSNYTNIFVPTFHFGNPKYHECAVDTRKMGAVLNGDDHCKANMLELKNKIQELFELSNDEAKTTFLLDEFIKDIKEQANAQ